MTSQSILTRTYSALTAIGFMVIGMLLLVIWPVDVRNSMAMEYTGVSFFALLSLGICWIMTRHNPPLAFKWHAGVIIVASLAYVYYPLFSSHLYRLFYITPETRFYIILGVYCLCVGVGTWLSNTKYHNILPNQSKGVSTTFRVVSWFGQIAVWGFGIAMLLTVVGVIG